MENKEIRNQSDKNEELINIADLIKIFTKNWKWFALSVFLFLSIGAYYVLSTNSKYLVDAKVLLREDEKKMSSSSAVSMAANLSDLGSMMGSKNIDNEVEIFNTRRIMKRSVLDLNMYISMTMRVGLKKINPYPVLPYLVHVDSLQVDTIKRPISLTIKPQKDGTYKIKGKYYKTKFETIVQNFPANIKTPSIDVAIDKNPLYAITKKNQFKTVDITISNPNVVAISLKKEISAEATSKKTTIIALYTTTDNVRWSQDLLNKMIENFNKDAIEDKNLIATLTADFVKDRLIKIEEEIKMVEQEVQNYKQLNQFTDFASEIKINQGKLLEYEGKAVEAEIQLNMIKYIKEYIANPKNKDNLIPTIGIEDRGLVGIIVKYNELLAERNRLKNAATEINPGTQLVDAQLVSMRENILGNIDNISQSIQIMLDDVKRQDWLANSKIKSIPRQEREFVEIVRQQSIRNAVYTFLLQKREETNLNLASSAPKARIIDEPMPGLLPVAPKKKAIALMFLCLGVFVPFAFFYTKKLLKTELDSKEELEALSQVEIIGEICKSEKQEKIVVKPHETTSSVELFRLLRTNLTFVLRDNSQKVILLTSTVSGEGKTFISINLALSLALIEKKILVVGLDIRNPRLGDYLEAPTGKGITNFLIDSSLKTTDIIQQSKVNPYLDIVQAGPIPPNPNELLMSSRLDDLFADFRKMYDYIIVDTAPIGMVSDTFLLNRLADVNLYVVRIGHAHKDSVRYLNSIKRNGKLKNLYVIANDIDLKAKNGGYGYGYGRTK